MPIDRDTIAKMRQALELTRWVPPKVQAKRDARHKYRMWVDGVEMTPKHPRWAEFKAIFGGPARKLVPSPFTGPLRFPRTKKPSRKLSP